MSTELNRGADRQLGLHVIKEAGHYHDYFDARGPEFLETHPDAAAAAAERREKHLGEAAHLAIEASTEQTTN